MLRSPLASPRLPLRSPTRRVRQSGIRPSEDSPVGPDAHRTKAHIDVGERDPEQTHPRPEHVPPIEAAHTTVCFLTDWLFRELIAAPANQMAKRVTTESVAAEHDGVHGQHNRPHTDAERGLPGRRVCEPHCLPRVM